MLLQLLGGPDIEPSQRPSAVEAAAVAGFTALLVGAFARQVATTFVLEALGEGEE